MTTQLKQIFTDFMEKESLFLDKKVLQSNYCPEEIFHREEQISAIGKIVAPCLRLERPSNLFIYGKTGTGKTLSVLHISKSLTEVAKQKNIPLKILYLNCKLKKIADTEYRLVAQLARDLGKEIPSTGLPTEEVYKIFFHALDKEKQIVLLVLDEIDQLVKKTGDEFLYNLTRINSELKNAQVSIIGVSNDLSFTDYLDPRVKSSLSEEEIIFSPYNAVQIQDILRERSKKAFRKGVLQEGVLQKCAAYAAREHGDARRALELLRISGELAEREGKEIISVKDLDLAEEKIEKDRILDVVTTQPKQHQIVLKAVLELHLKKRNNLVTGEIYELYRTHCQKNHLRPLTQRRISDILAEFDMLGIINAKVISKGRYGRTREISLALEPGIENKVRTFLDKEIAL